MIRNVDLVSYLPPIMAEFQEYRATLEAENPEFVLVWNATDQVLQNEFIATADEYGISRFEQILNILPSKEDTLESRRSRVQTRWFNTIPYTLKALLGKLIALCGENNFTVVKDYDHYKISIFTDLELFGQAEQLTRLSSLSPTTARKTTLSTVERALVAHRSAPNTSLSRMTAPNTPRLTARPFMAVAL